MLNHTTEAAVLSRATRLNHLYVLWYWFLVFLFPSLLFVTLSLKTGHVLHQSRSFGLSGFMDFGCRSACLLDFCSWVEVALLLQQTMVQWQHCWLPCTPASQLLRMTIAVIFRYYQQPELECCFNRTDVVWLHSGVPTWEHMSCTFLQISITCLLNCWGTFAALAGSLTFFPHWQTFCTVV